MKKSSIAKKILKIAGVAFGIIILVLYFIFPVGVGWFSTWRHPSEVGLPPESFIELTLTTSDNVKLQAWYAPPKNNCVILLLHGATGSREGIRPYAKMLKDNGFGVLAFDMRGHGESGGKGNAYGWSGTSDIGTALEFLNKQKEVKLIGALGLSMGGEVLLGAASEYPEIKVIVSDGATSRSLGDYMVLPKNKSLERNYFSRVVYKTVQVISGETPPQTIVESISSAKATKFLFIAAGDVQEEIEYNSYFQKVVGKHSNLWVVTEAKHTGAFALNPKEYEKRIVDFFEDSLINN